MLAGLLDGGAGEAGISLVPIPRGGAGPWDCQGSGGGELLCQELNLELGDVDQGLVAFNESSPTARAFSRLFKLATAILPDWDGRGWDRAAAEPLEMSCRTGSALDVG